MCCEGIWERRFQSDSKQKVTFSNQIGAKYEIHHDVVENGTTREKEGAGEDSETPTGQEGQRAAASLGRFH